MTSQRTYGPPRPILFSGPMVRAILAGIKTQTRRVVAPSTSLVNGYGVRRFPEGQQWDVAHADKGPSPAGNPGPYLHVPRDDSGDVMVDRIYPRWAPGDRLWVRETWGEVFEVDISQGRPVGPLGLGGIPARPDMKARVIYRADGEFESRRSDGLARGWTPSIFMPRWASRLTLEITEIRVERVRSISKADAAAEGFPMPAGCLNYRDDFSDLWDSINGKRPGCAWADNPWVWAISFRLLPQASEALP